MANILDQLAEYARVRVENDKKIVDANQMRRYAEALYAGSPEAEVLLEGAIEQRPYGEKQLLATSEVEAFRFEKALKAPGMSFITEVKKASPSKGLIAPDFPYAEIAKSYEAAGASCISCLTEPKWFLGSDRYLYEITEAVTTPVIRKDFTVDPYQIYQAKTLGASAVLLICAILETEQIREYIAVADSIGLSAIVEAHDEAEVMMALDAGARIVGVNNRNLKDFTVDIHNSMNLRALAPEDKIFVAESGIKTASDIKTLYEGHVDAVLIGETLMRSPDKKAMLDELRSEMKL